jgi:RHS repeat-associated protein
MLDNLSLTHMNGRIYDQELGRFLSADPFIPSILTQDFNRYSYVANNPLSLTDPSGFTPRIGTPKRVDGDDDMMSPQEELAWGRAALAGQWRWGGFGGPRMGSFSGMGWFQYTRMQGYRNSDGAQQIAGFAGDRLGAQPSTDREPGGSQIIIQNEDGTETVRFTGESGATLPPLTIKPGFWDANGTVYNTLGAGFLNCFFSVTNHCSGAQFAEEGANYAANIVPVIKLGGTAARGGVAAVQVGQAGEAAVRAAVNIGSATRITINGATRIPDGLTARALTEVKNVGSLSYTQQLRDFASFAQQTGRQFDLYVRPNTQLSGPLLDAIHAGQINLRYIPGL